MSTPDEATIRDATPPETAAIAKLNALGGYLSSPLPPNEAHSTWIVRVWHPQLATNDGIEASAGTRAAALIAAVDGLDRALEGQFRPRPVPKPSAKAKPKASR